MDFSPHNTGHFLSGDNDGTVLHWEPIPGGWNVNAAKPFLGHTGSVEDVQWKRRGDGCPHVFATASSDRSARIWDVRVQDHKKPSLCLSDAHDADVNVLSWSPCVGELLATASDDGGFKVWDVRNVDAGPMAFFSFHKKTDNINRLARN